MQETGGVELLSKLTDLLREHGKSKFLKLF